MDTFIASNIITDEFVMISVGQIIIRYTYKNKALLVE